MQRLPFVTPDDLREAVPACLAALDQHGIVAIPTETFYGLAVRPDDAVAVDRLLVLKGRPAEKALPLVAADLAQVGALVRVSPVWWSRLQVVWPAPLSVVAPLHSPLAACGQTAAVRVPDHALLRSLLHLVGPLTATSANAAGRPPASTAEEVIDSLGEGLALLLDGGATAGGQPSTLVEISVDPPKLLRPGAFHLPPSWGVKTA
jgi:L-threonylcarbamoyladenylate synthase